MIALAGDCLLFQLSSGELIPFSADMLSVEMLGNAARCFDTEFVTHAAKAVFHYFKHDLSRQVVGTEEFAGALEKVLQGFLKSATISPQDSSTPYLIDLCRLAQESGDACELLFFPRLRDELRCQLGQSRRIVRFYGLRGCVKRLAGAQYWCPRCRVLQEQIVGFLRGCLGADAGRTRVAMLVD
jgi:hypothetical protein